MLHCGPVGGTRLLSAFACAMALAFVPAASGATGDLTVTVTKLDVQSTIERGKLVSFGVKYTVRGPLSGARSPRSRSPDDRPDSARATRSRLGPQRVRPAIWQWGVTDTLPSGLTAGSTGSSRPSRSKRGKTRVARATRIATVTVS